MASTRSVTVDTDAIMRCPEIHTYSHTQQFTKMNCVIATLSAPGPWRLRVAGSTHTRLSRPAVMQQARPLPDAHFGLVCRGSGRIRGRLCSERLGLRKQAIE
jgi:hypothetical protein